MGNRKAPTPPPPGAVKPPPPPAPPPKRDSRPLAVTQSRLRAEVNARFQTHAVQRDRCAVQGRQKDSDINAAIVGALEWVLTLLDDPEAYPHVDTDPRGDRDFIEKKWREGERAATHDLRSQADGWRFRIGMPPLTPCPYESSSLAGKWWMRGYQSGASSQYMKLQLGEEA